MESSEQCNNVYNLMLKNFAGADGIYVADMSKNDVSARRASMYEATVALSVMMSGADLLIMKGPGAADMARVYGEELADL